MEDISSGITRLIHELKALQVQLQWNTFQISSQEAQNHTLDHVLNSGVGKDLKRTIDAFSQFLWCYIESAAAQTNTQLVDYVQQSRQLAQATEMLRLLHRSSACPLMESL